MIVSKYLTGLIQVLFLLMTALLAAMEDGVDTVEVWQLAGVLVGAVVTVWVPLLEGAWAAGLKVGGAVAGAAIAAIVPLVMSEWTASAAIIVVIAIINALATQLGVSIRVDAAKNAIADSQVSARAAEAVDPYAAAIADRSV